MIHLLVHARVPSEAGVSLLEFACSKEQDIEKVLAGMRAGGYTIESASIADPEKVASLDAQYQSLEQQSNEQSKAHQKERDDLHKQQMKECVPITRQLQAISDERKTLWKNYDL